MASIDSSFRPAASTILPLGEVEVASIEYRDAMKDAGPAGSPGVAVVLGRWRGAMLHYRVEVDGGCEELCRRPCKLPLTLGQLIHFIDCSCNGVACWAYLERMGQRPADMPRFRVASKQYPMLAD